MQVKRLEALPEELAKLKGRWQTEARGAFTQPVLVDGEKVTCGGAGRQTLTLYVVPKRKSTPKPKVKKAPVKKAAKKKAPAKKKAAKKA